jgi:hypothetical protein
VEKQMQYSFDPNKVVNQAVELLCSVGFSSAKAMNMITENAASLRQFNKELTHDEAMQREAAATLIRFGNHWDKMPIVLS